jgi:Arylsulfotransferase (ASST)
MTHLQPTRSRRLSSGAALLLLVLLGRAGAQQPDAPAAPAASKPPGPPMWSEKEASGERGLRVHESDAFEGFTLLAPLNSKAVHLVAMDGTVAHSWATPDPPGASCELLSDGRLFRCGQQPDNPRFHGGGIGGHLQILAWDGSVAWDYLLADADLTQHHEAQPLPSGNLLVIAWEHHTRDEAIGRGRDPDVVGDEGLWSDVLLELKPVPPADAEIVWRWSTWDHLVQDRDRALPEYGAPASRPGRIDINADHRFEPKEEQESEEARAQREAEEAQMRALGYVGGAAPPPTDEPKKEADWLHTNGVDYHAGLDLVVLSVPHVGELWVIDHSTTTEEAAGAAGGRRGHGGELLWRWGNPRNAGLGGAQDQRLFYQHDPTWLPDGPDGAPRLLVFDNGRKRADGEHSEVLELHLPFDPARGFVRADGQAFGPAEPAWTYANGTDFYSGFISGAQRLPNGHTLICSGAPGHVFEVTPEGRIVWDYLNPLGGDVTPSEQGGKAPPHALFRAARIAPDDPRLAGKL